MCIRDRRWMSARRRESCEPQRPRQWSCRSRLRPAPTALAPWRRGLAPVLAVVRTSRGVQGDERIGGRAGLELLEYRRCQGRYGARREGVDERAMQATLLLE